MKKLLSQIAVLCLITGCAVATEEACQENEHLNEGVCEKDTLEQCGSPDNNCTRQKGWKKGVCAEGECIASDCKDGYVVKQGVCTAENPDLTCADNEHVYGKKCEKDTLDHCGEHDNDCSEIEGWGSGRCSKGECIVTACADGYVLDDGKCSKETSTTTPSTLECPKDTHPFESGCENDSINHCGSHDNDCTLLEGWKDGLCVNGACFITECQEGYIISDGKCTSNVTEEPIEDVPVDPPLVECGDGTHLYDGSCEADTTDNCGTHGINCANIDGWGTGTCTNAQCVATSCKENYNLNAGICTAVVPLECTETQHVYDGYCEDDSPANCGVHGTNCMNMIGWLTGNCDHKMCVPSQCNSGFCIDPSTHICVNGASTTNACGINGGACVVCSAGQRCNNGQCETPPPECSTTQHVYEGNCEDDTKYHCGSHNNECKLTGASDYKCESKQCIPITCSSGYYLYNNACHPNDDDNCGAYKKKCTSDSTNHIAASKCNTSGGYCYITKCDDSSHLFESKCEPDDISNCGAHGKACKTEDYPHSTKLLCQSKECKIIKCTAGLEISGNKCVGQNGCPIGNPYSCDGACCQKAGCSGSCIMAY